MVPPLGELEDEEPESLLRSRSPGQALTVHFWLFSTCAGGDEEEEEEGGAPWNVEGGTPRFSLGGTGGKDPPASDRDKLRLGFLLSPWLGLRQGVATLSLSSRVNLDSGAAMMSLGVKPSNTVKQMDSCDSLRCVGGGGSGAGQKRMGAVLRRLNTVLGLGTGFTTGLLLSTLVNMAARFGAELFLNASK